MECWIQPLSPIQTTPSNRRTPYITPHHLLTSVHLTPPFHHANLHAQPSLPITLFQISATKTSAHAKSQSYCYVKKINTFKRRLLISCTWVKRWSSFLKDSLSVEHDNINTTKLLEKHQEHGYGEGLQVFCLRQKCWKWDWANIVVALFGNLKSLKLSCNIL